MHYRLSTIVCLLALIVAAFALPQPSQSEVFTREYRVSTGSDDATEYTSGEDIGYVSTGSSDLDLEVGKMVGVRFQGIQVPPGAVITNAYIVFTAEDPDSGSWVMRITGQDSDNAATFTSSDYNISNRPETSATVTWADGTSWSDGSTYVTPALTSIVNEIVSRPGWIKGNSLLFIFLGQDDERDAWSYNGSSSRAPLLHIEFTSLSTHTITASAGYGGTISPAGQVSVLDGDSETFSIIPDAGNSVAEVLVDGISSGAPFSYTFNNVTSDHYITAVFNLPADCSDLSSVPLGTVKRSAPPNIMFVLDDSGSMDWEFLTTESDGKFQTFQYVFDNPGDNVFADSTILNERDRMQWKSQWSVYNRVYYDPSVTYEPWPTLNNADPDNPRSHPTSETPTFALNNTYYLFDFGIVVDDVDSGFTKSPGWVAVWVHSESYLNHFWETPENGAPSTATWTPILPAGDYDVFAWWRSADHYSDVVEYTINHAGVPDIVQVNQRINEKQWNRLGSNSYPFDGISGDVTLYNTPNLASDRACADAVKFLPVGVTPIDIPNAHYYTFDDANANDVYDAGETVYLVVIEGTGGAYTIRYYQATISGSGATEAVTGLVEVTAPNIPASVQSARTPAEERQNFANWYSYYRRRELTATAAVANAIANMQGVNVGLYSIHQSVVQPVLKVKAQGENQANFILDQLYSLTVTDTLTALRRGLEAVGRYFNKDDNIKLDGTAGDDSPYEATEDGGACQQAFAILITDGYWNGDPPLNTSIDNADGDNGVPYADGYSDTLADVAMFYYENDLSSSLGDEVPTNLKDGADWQHMVTYTVAFGVSGTLNPADYDEDFKHKTTGVLIEWPDPAAGNDQKIDDVWHAAVNGRGEFLSALNAEELANALLSVKQNIEARTGSAAPVSVNGVELYEEVASELFMFQSTYNSDGWTGDVKAYPVNPTTGEVSETPEWSAADWLDATATQWLSRRIATYNPSNTPPGVPFTWPNLNAEQQDQLRDELDVDWIPAQNRLKFLRGHRSLEQQNGGDFRDRFSILGDVVHSSPVFENGVLYTGGNDGMLHAFRATNGSEIFAYIPNIVFENLKNLADPSYYGNHTYYVDLSPVIQRGVELSPGSAKTLLVGGLGRGGKGYYALDITGITENTSFAIDLDVGDRFLWEYPNSATPVGEINDVGYSYARPAIVNSQAGWIVIAGNGYNSVNGNAVLLILDPSNGQVLKRIDTGVGSCNGLSTPVVIDVNYDDKVDYVYAGDLRGNLWKFDLTNADYNSWTVAYKDGGGNPQPLFQALGQPITTKPDVMRHPTKHGYLVVFGTGKYLGITDFADTSLNTIYGVWDYGDDSDDTEYLGFFNRGSATNKLSNQPANVTLVEQDYVTSPETDPNFPFFWTFATNGEQLKLRILTNNIPNWETVDDLDFGEQPNPGSATDPPNTVHAGWYFDLPLDGERVASDVLVREGNAIVITFTPVDEPCGIGGDSIIHEMDAASGGRLLRAQFDIDADNLIGSQDLINIGDETNPVLVAPTGLQKTGRLHAPAILRMGSTEMKYFSSSEGTIKTVREVPARLGVRYWRELE
ncbi:MAG TPA: PilC/PilY family type IV pilus protein [Desulfatiglandales bacterium]|nr:PilC/PilY family type IV pilus protein [Desulfatiglandales bacterium]